MIGSRVRLVCGLTFASAALALAACGAGSGGSALPGPLAPGYSTTSMATKLGLTYGGSSLPFAQTRRSTSSVNRHTLQVNGTPVTVTYNGVVVASGTLDGNGYAELTFTAGVPVGATVTVTAGTGSNAVTATIVLTTAIPATASDVVYQPATSTSAASLKVTSAADAAGNGQVEASDPDQQVEIENPSDGTPENVDSADSDHLPANLPITLSVCAGSTITVAPAPSAPPLVMQFEEKVHDSDSGAQLEYTANPFSSPLTFPVISSAARVDIEISSGGKPLVSIEAPIQSFTGPAGNASPSPSPSSCPTLSPIAFTTPSPGPGSGDSGTASPSPSASPSP